MTHRMIRLLKTISVIIGMLLNLLSFALVIAALVLDSKEIPPSTGVSRSFGMWVYSVFTAIMSIYLYLIDLYTSFRHLRSRKILLILKILLVLGSIPMVILIGGRLGICILIWNIYFAVVFLIEIISFIQVIRDHKILKP